MSKNDENTLIFVYVFNDTYTRKYDIDLLEEINRDKIAKVTCAISVENEFNFSWTTFGLESKYIIN